MAVFCSKSFFYIAIVLLLSSCNSPAFQSGFLTVKAIDNRTYEIYRVAKTDPLQYISEDVGRYNEKIPLQPGRYLVLADCSHKFIVIRPNEDITLQTKKIEFITPIDIPKAKRKEASFSVQCNRTERGDFGQRLSNKFQFYVFPGVHSLLVGMQTLKITAHETQDLESEKILLSGLRVYDPSRDESRSYNYFVSPTAENLSITQRLKIGKWILLLPSNYEVALHGTSIEKKLLPNKSYDIQVGFINIFPPKEADLDEITAVRGKPLSLKINEKHLIPVDLKYPVLPGEANLQLESSTHIEKVSIKAGKTTKVELSAVKLTLECSPWEWSCLGTKEIQLFESGEYYPFLESYSDIPVLYFTRDIAVGLTSSKDIKLEIPEKSKFKALKIGVLEISPKPRHVPGRVSDLVRLETVQKKFTGYSMDVPYEKPSKLFLLAGTYKLAHYVANANYEGDRSVSYRYVKIYPGKSTKISVRFLLSEKKYNRILAKQKKKLSANKNGTNEGERKLFF